MIALSQQANDAISFEPKAFEIVNEVNRAMAQVQERSVFHARSRSATIVNPQDVQAALQETFAELSATLAAVASGTIPEIEFTITDFEYLRRLPFQRDDAVSDADDDL